MFCFLFLGKGSIYVWATGNGGLADDDCNCDGYTSSIYTISIGAVSRYGLSTYYDEQCSSTMAVTFTGDTHVGGTSEADLVTTDLHHGCTSRFRGTSSAAPLASGMFALVLEANKDLTWRDLQHIVVHTAVKTSPEDDGWKTNAANLKFNHKFGFGRLSARKMVDAALNWKTVGKQHICKVLGPLDSNPKIPVNGSLQLKVYSDGCQGNSQNSVKKLEHVQATVSFKLYNTFRGDISIDIVSPGGTLSQLLSSRRKDDDKLGLTGWDFMTVHLWGESPEGEWKLVFHHNNRRMDIPKKPDIEERERVLIEHDLLKAKRDEIVDDYDHYHDEIHHGRFGKDYMRDQVSPVQEDESTLDDLMQEEDSISHPGVAGVVKSWGLTFYGTGEERN